MKRKLLVLGILLMTMMACLPVMAVQADPIDEWDTNVVILGMKLRHRELRDLDTESWVFTLGEIQNPSKYYWYRDVSVTDSSNQYDLDWTGRLYWSIFTREWSYEYTEYFDFNVNTDKMHKHVILMTYKRDFSLPERNPYETIPAFFNAILPLLTKKGQNGDLEVVTC